VAAGVLGLACFMLPELVLRRSLLPCRGSTTTCRRRHVWSCRSRSESRKGRGCVDPSPAPALHPPCTLAHLAHLAPRAGRQCPRLLSQVAGTRSCRARPASPARSSCRPRLSWILA
jgi:hypothetical protein